MKKRILYLIAALAALVSCENVIPVDFGDSEPQIVINAQLLSRGGEQLVYLSETSRTKLLPLQEAEVTVEIDGQEPILAEGIPVETSDYYAAAYRFNANIPAGKEVKVSARKGKLEGWAVAEGTETATISSVDTLRLTERDFDATYETFYFKVTFTDLPGDSFYRIGVRMDSQVHQVDAEGRTMDIPTQYELPVEGKNDPILGGNTMTVSIFSLEPTYLVFTDDLFRDETCTVRLSVPVSSLYPYYYSWEEDFTPSYAVITTTFIPWLETISKEEYYYLSALNNLENFGYEGQMLVEPTMLPSNVYGGLGFVSVRNRSESKPIKGMETYYDYTYYEYYDDEAVVSNE